MTPGPSAAGAHPAPPASDAPVLRVTGASAGVGGRTLWSGLDLSLRAGEFVAVLGANGAGKTTLLRTILGMRPLDAGSIALAGRPVGHGDRRIGYIPQQRPLPRGTALRGRDLVALGLDGDRFGLPLRSREKRARVDAALAEADASRLATVGVGDMSGGELQRLRVAQALVADPLLLLCDEPLLSLDLLNQRRITQMIAARRDAGTSVLFVTHDVNPILGELDRILYLAGHRFVIGTPDEVLRSSVLTDLYGTPVEVIRSGGHVAVLGLPDAVGAHDETHVAEGPATGALPVAPDGAEGAR